LSPIKGRRDEFVEPCFKRAKPDAIVVVLKAREPARIMIANGMGIDFSRPPGEADPLRSFRARVAEAVHRSVATRPAKRTG
jgi:hypothetical protein